MKIGGGALCKLAPLPKSEPLMQKLTLIAKCLLGSFMVTSLAAGEPILESN